MKNSNKFLPTGANAALISIHPEYAEKILMGEKRLEYRRRWAATPVDVLVIYATTPVQRVVGLAQVEAVVYGSKTKLWELGKHHGGGISRRKLFAYLAGKKEAVAITLGSCHTFKVPLDPHVLFESEFKPPQSFRYLKQSEINRINKLLTRQSNT